jgi:hypothetical protein
MSKDMSFGQGVLFLSQPAWISPWIFGEVIGGILIAGWFVLLAQWIHWRISHFTGRGR